MATATMLLGSGVLLGRYMTVRSLSEHIQNNYRASTLGQLVHDREATPKVSKAYYDTKNSLSEMDSYLWVAPHVMTPFVGHGPEPGVHHNSTINPSQLRGSYPPKLPKPSGVYRIFLVGGSTAFGSGAPNDNQTIGGYLEAYLNNLASTPDKNRLRFEVFTFAQPAWASTHERIVIENRIIELMPDLVISLSGINDIHWGLGGRNILWFRSYADEHYWKVVNEVHAFLGLPRMADVTTVSSDPISCDLVATRLRSNVALSSFALQLVDAKYLFVLQPSAHVSERDLYAKLADPTSVREYWSGCYASIDRRLKALRRNNLYYLSLVGLFDDRDKAEIYLDAYHLGNRGNDLVADAIRRRVVEAIL
ncbi:MAG: hypothetical protein MJD61_16755 [Proteobacteria bacterium]|nr:hypothetical protein [Pseudomonadota bacterium]